MDTQHDTIPLLPKEQEMIKNLILRLNQSNAASQRDKESLEALLVTIVGRVNGISDTEYRLNENCTAIVAMEKKDVTRQ